MKILFVVNPIAGKGRAKGIVATIEKICKNYDVDFDIEYTKGPGDGIRVAKEGVKKGYGKIVSVGGDGTLNEVVNGIAGSEVILGVIPGGTGNDFIRTIYKSATLEEIIVNILRCEGKSIDLGMANGRYFINIASGGFDAEAALESEKNRGVFSGSMSYLVALIKTIFTYRAKMLKVSIDGNVFEKRTLLVAVANGRYYGGGILPAPSASLNDGIFDVCFVEKMSKLKMLILFPRYMKGTHEGIKGVSLYRGCNIKITSDNDFGVNIDGEVSLKKSVEFNIIPGGIKIAACEDI